jgi:hypothetical protein
MIIFTFIEGVLDVNIINCALLIVGIEAIGAIIGLAIAGGGALIAAVFGQ